MQLPLVFLDDLLLLEVRVYDTGDDDHGDEEEEQAIWRMAILIVSTNEHFFYCYSAKSKPAHFVREREREKEKEQ